ncbi:MAG: hypothetical protein A2846_03400 [Candidatus Doudnabacteria bacterium RIFCSPHIGHO2_01_FULL_49_9]|uniref:Fe2OG dioxygenase domain-containing protein n=2 Tax=Bacteria candidate phyla TaxID=1783234 RepID=A0A1F5NZ22_9BACT|nr:MAG: hypothetical protein A2846_03400 [Candidatus Doudnabacteria bacterium RIFCSPHIGHO2_01_FULL_49_9]
MEPGDLLSLIAMKNLSFDQILNEVKQKNYAVLPFGMSKADLDGAAADFMEFLKIPQETKDKFYFKLDPKNHGSNIGYVRKSKAVGDGDNKEYFHYNLYAEDLLVKIPESDSIPAVKKFFDSARKIYALAENALGETMKEFDNKYPGIYGKFFRKDTHPFFYLRFLKYDIAGKGNFLARAHYDRGQCTLALAESAPGLRIGRNDATLKEVDRVDGTILFMPALGFSDITSTDFTPAWHDVVQSSNDLYNRDVARWAIVFFADTRVDNYMTMDEAHTAKG